MDCMLPYTVVNPRLAPSPEGLAPLPTGNPPLIQNALQRPFLLAAPIYSAIHKAAVQNGLWRAFCTAVPFDILGIIPGKAVEWP